MIDRPSPLQRAYIEITGAHALVAYDHGERAISYGISAQPWLRVGRLVVKAGKITGIAECVWLASEDRAQKALAHVEKLPDLPLMHAVSAAGERVYSHEAFMNAADRTIEAAKDEFERLRKGDDGRLTPMGKFWQKDFRVKKYTAVGKGEKRPSWRKYCDDQVAWLMKQKIERGG